MEEKWQPGMCLHSLGSNDLWPLKNFTKIVRILTLREAILAGWKASYGIKTTEGKKIWRETQNDLKRAILNLSCPEDCKKAGQELRQKMIDGKAEVVTYPKKPIYTCE
jgi:hypothetical protein